MSIGKIVYKSHNFGIEGGFYPQVGKWELIWRCWQDLELNYSHFEKMYAIKSAALVGG